MVFSLDETSPQASGEMRTTHFSHVIKISFSFMMMLSIFRLVAVITILKLLPAVAQTYEPGLLFTLTPLQLDGTELWSASIRSPAPQIPYTYEGMSEYCKHYDQREDERSASIGSVAYDCVALDNIMDIFETENSLKMTWSGQWYFDPDLYQAMFQHDCDQVPMECTLTLNGGSQEAFIVPETAQWVNFNFEATWKPDDNNRYPVFNIHVNDVNGNLSHISFSQYTSFQYDIESPVLSVDPENKVFDEILQLYDSCGISNFPGENSETREFFCWWPGVHCLLTENSISISGLTEYCANFADFKKFSSLSLSHFGSFGVSSFDTSDFPREWRPIIERMNLQALEISDIDDVRRFTNLIALDLGPQYHNGEDLTKLESLANLEYLRFSVTPTNGKSYEFVEYLENLRYISLSIYSDLSHEFISDVWKNMSSLEYIEVISDSEMFSFTCNDWEFLQNLKTLILSVHVTGFGVIYGCDLSDVISLEHLYINGENLNESWDGAGLPLDLVDLHISKGVTELGKTTEFSYFTQLISLTIDTSDLSDWEGEGLPDSLQYISLESCDLTRFPDLAYLSQLNTLNISTADMVGTDYGLGQIGLLVSSNLEYLACSNCRLYEVLPENLPSMLPDLSTLLLDGNYFYSSDLKLDDENAINSTADFDSVSALPRGWEGWVENIEINLEGSMLQGYTFDWIPDSVNLKGNPIWSCQNRSRPDPYEPVSVQEFDCASESNHQQHKVLYVSTDMLNLFSNDFTLSMSFYAESCSSGDAIVFHPSWSNNGFIVYENYAGEDIVTFEFIANNFSEVSESDLRAFSLNEEVYRYEICFCGSCIGDFLLLFDNFCTPGQYVGDGSISSTNKSCLSCEIGLFSTAVDSELCSECEIGSYNTQPGSVSCTKCPEGLTTRNKASQQVDHCVCPEGTYGNSTPCTSCPDGATCATGAIVPQVDTGYWVYPNDYSRILQCNPIEACEKTDNGETTCAPGYQGEVCSDCSFGYYKFGVECRECPSRSIGIYIGFGCFVIFAVLWSLKIAIPRTSKIHSAGIVMSWLQILSLFGSLPTQWPRSASVLFQYLSFFNFNVDFLSPECSVPVKYWTKWFSKLLIPFFIMSMLLIVYLCQELFVKCFPNRPRFFVMGIKDFIMEVKRLFYCCGKICNRGKPRLPPAEYVKADPNAKERYVYTIVMLLPVMYTYLCVTLFEPISCAIQPDGTYTMIQHPPTVCFDRSWTLTIFPFVIFFFFLWGVGIPMLVFGLLHMHRDNITSTKFLKRYGTLILPYRLQVPWFEGFNLFRKCSVVMLLQFLRLSSTSHLDVIGLLIFMLFFISVYTTFDPYRNPENNMLARLWVILSIYCLFASIILNGNLLDFERTFYGDTLIVIFVVVSIYSIIVAFKEARYGVYIAVTERKNKMNMMQVTADYEEGLKEYFPKSSSVVSDYVSKLSLIDRARFMTDLRRWNPVDNGSDDEVRMRTPTVHHDFRTSRDFTTYQFAEEECNEE